jgi:hypothetical protein
MMLHRGLWAGACLFLLVSLPGCSDDSDDNKVTGGGVYSPIITGIDADNEPAVRGVPNTFTALVTNVNGYPVTYHWSATAGVLTDSTSVTATWTAPDAIGTYPLTVSIEAQDSATGAKFFESTTFQIFVDNNYVRWTTSAEVQFDPDPMPSGGVLFAQLRNAATGAADIYSVATPGLSPTQLTTGFASITSPTMRADGAQIAFAGEKASSEPKPSIYLLPGAGGDTSMAQVAALTSAGQPGLWAPRFARAGNWLFYNSDSTRVGSPRPWFRDAFNLLAPPEPVIVPGTFLLGAAFYQPAIAPIWTRTGCRTRSWPRRTGSSGLPIRKRAGSTSSPPGRSSRWRRSGCPTARRRSATGLPTASISSTPRRTLFPETGTSGSSTPPHPTRRRRFA